MPLVDQPAFVYAAMAAIAIAVLYSGWIGFSRFEVVVLIVLWASYFAIKVLAFLFWDSPLETLEAVLQVMLVLHWIQCGSAFILVGSVVFRSCKLKGAPVPFLRRSRKNKKN